MGMGDEVAVAVAGSFRAVVGGMVAVICATGADGDVQAVRAKKNRISVIAFIIRPVAIWVGRIILKGQRKPADCPGQ